MLIQPRGARAGRIFRESTAAFLAAWLVAWAGGARLPAAEAPKSVSREALLDTLGDVMRGRTTGDLDESAEIVPGLTHRITFHSQPRPILVNAFHFSMQEDGLRLDLIKATGKVTARERIETMARGAESPGMAPLAGVNGGFWGSDERPVGVAAGGGSVFTAVTHKWTFLLDETGTPYIGPATVRRRVIRGDTKFDLTGYNDPNPLRGFHFYTPAYGALTPTLPEDTLVVGLDFDAASGVKINVPLELKVRESREGFGELDIRPGQAWLARMPLGSDKTGWKFAKGDTARLEIACEEVTTPIALAVSAGPILLREGKSASEQGASDFAALGGGRPDSRTALGVIEVPPSIVLLTVDGAAFGSARGLNFEELATEMARQGATEAIALDGGSSTAAWSMGALVNRPSGLFGSRAISDALFVFRVGETQGKPRGDEKE